MKYFNIFLVFIALLASCKQQQKASGADESAGTEVTQPGDMAAFTAVGDPLSEAEVADPAAMALLYDGLAGTDTVRTAFRAEVLEVCQAKGCWMRLALPDQRTVMVRFKDYGFFVPKDIAGSEVTVEGKAFVSVVPEDERRHLAADGGASEAELMEISGPVSEPGFEASGVRIWE